VKQRLRLSNGVDGTADMGVYVCHPYGERENRENVMLKGFKTRHLDHSSAAAMAVVWKTFSTGTSMENDFFHFVDGSILTCSMPLSLHRAYHEAVPTPRYALNLIRPSVLLDF